MLQSKREVIGILTTASVTALSHQFVMISDFPQVIKMGCSGIYAG